ncbi:MAG: histidine kinase [Vallitaleaceae bacterium]|nr:histidine kinase [Vallitaleaceae bacterium]
MQKKGWTLNVRLLLITVLISIPILIVLLSFNQANIRNVREDKLAQSQAEVTAEVSQFDTMLELLEISMINLTANNSDFRVVASAREKDLEFWRANQRSMLKIQNLSDASTLEYTIFVYYPTPSIFINRSIQKELLGEIQLLIDQGRGLPLKNQWNTLQSEGISYAVRIIAYEDYYVGAFLTYDSLMKKLGVKNTADTRYYFFDEENRLLNEESGKQLQSARNYQVEFEEKKWYRVFDDSSKGAFSLMKLIQIESLNEEVPKISNSILLAGTVLLLALSIYILGIYYWVISPMNHMKRSMSVIEAGDMTYRIPKKAHVSLEFENVRTRFNAMMDQLEQLKILIYEGKLERQETKLQYLSQQIQPHFILNSLNSLYNYCDRDSQTTKEMILLLSKFYRYVVNINSKYVSLGQELEHIENYLQLQKVRFPLAFEYQITCPQALEIVPVPPFLIESFVVNAMKYGLIPEKKGLIEVEVKALDEFMIQIRIADDGEGFSEEVLESVEEYLLQRKVSSELGVGLKNAMERLKLIYQERARIRFYNQKPQGAVVEIEVELQPQKQEESHGNQSIDY